MHHVGNEFADVLQFAVAMSPCGSDLETRRGVPEFLGLVTDALEVGDGLDDRHDQAEVRRGRRTRGEDAAAIFIDRDFHRVDLVILPGHLFTKATVPAHDRLHPVLELLFDEASHLQHARPDAFEFGVVATVDVVRKVGGVHHGY